VRSGSHRLSLSAVTSGDTAAEWARCLRLGAVVVVGILVGELAYIACASPYLCVREVVVRGDARVVEQVIPRISLPANTNMFRAPMDLLREQIEAVPAVRHAYVVRDFPRRLSATVERREPVAVIRQAKRALLVDPEGVVFEIPGNWGWGLPELAGQHLSEGELESAAASAEIAELLSVMRVFTLDPRLRMSRLAYGGDRELEVMLYSGPRAELGGTTELQAKARLLAATIEQLGAGRIGYVNLSDPRAAYWRPQESVLSAQTR